MIRRRQLFFENRRAVGDAVVLTAAVRDFKLAYPDIDICVGTAYPQIWLHNPYISQLEPPVERIGLAVQHHVRASQVGAIKMHYVQAFHKSMEEMLRMKVPVTRPKPDLHLTEKEKNSRPIAQPYWVIVAGTKRHATTKQWHVSRYQEVVNALLARGYNFVQIGATEDPVASIAHIHPRLEGVTDLVGRTDLRQLLRVVYHAEGIICPITAVMHIAAAFDKPCVVLAGGREEYSWVAYSSDNPAFSTQLRNEVLVSHRVLSSVGSLDCCLRGGCWKSHVEPTGVEPFTPSVKTLCPLPIASDPLTVPKCLDIISTSQVINAVLGYRKVDRCLSKETLWQIPPAG